MDTLFEQLEEWIKSILVPAVMENLTGVFDLMNSKVGEVATEVGTSPADFSPSVYSLIRNISENVIMPIAGIILTFIAVYELVQLVIAHNNLANFETWIFWKWIFKTFVAVTLITNTFNITMAIFDVANHVISQSAGIITDTTAIDASALSDIESTLEAASIGELIAIFAESCIIKLLLQIMAILIFVIVNGRMIEIYLTVSLAPIPFATFGNREQSMIGQNYLRSLLALGFQGFLILICVGIYAVLIQTAITSTDIMASLWNVLGISFLLGFTLFKTGAIASKVFHAH